MKTLVPILIVLSALFNAAFSQEIPDTLDNSRNALLNVYLDCSYCDFDYFRTNFTEVNYMHERQDADARPQVRQVHDEVVGRVVGKLRRVVHGGAQHRSAPVMTVATGAVVALSLAVAMFAGPLADLATRAAADLVDPSIYADLVLGGS